MTFQRKEPRCEKSKTSSCCNFNLNFLCLVGSVAGSDVGSRVGILSKFFIGNNLLIKLLRAFSLALNNNPKLFFKKKFFQLIFTFI